MTTLNNMDILKLLSERSQVQNNIYCEDHVYKVQKHTKVNHSV